MRFTKMHGAGNDYVYVDAFEERVADPVPLSIAISDRHKGIGADGLILICPPSSWTADARADARMEMYNADGSRAKMCGNGIRCVGKYLYERRGVRKNRLVIETDSGDKLLDLHVENGVVDQVTVDMGKPVLRFVDQEVRCGGGTARATCVSMGNPHCVVFLDRDPTDDDVFRTGPELERLPLFPERANVEFVRVLSDGEIRMRVWERGSGETQACGTGACAAAAAAAATNRTGRKVLVHLPGGDLRIEWAADDRVRMTGPAVEVFRGEWTVIGA